MATVQGRVGPGFEPIRDVFERQFADGEHIGAGVSVYSSGRKVVDLWGASLMRRPAGRGKRT